MSEKKPSLANKAANLAKEIKNVASEAIKTGKIKVSEEVSAARMDFCSKCDKYDGSTCRLCGCNMKIKTTLLVAKCPLNKWKE